MHTQWCFLRSLSLFCCWSIPLTTACSVSDNPLDVHIRHTLHTAHGILPMEVDFSLAGGGIMALTGPSGAGKTTLLRLIAGLIHPTSGRIAFQNEVWLDTASRV